MTTGNIGWGTTISPTITALNSLAQSATVGFICASIDNTTVKAIDQQVLGSLKVGATPTAGGTLEVWVAPDVDDAGSRFAGGGTGAASGSFTPVPKEAMRLLKTITILSTANATYDFFETLASIWSSMPKYIQIFILNNTNQALAASGNVLKVRPVIYTST